MLKTIAAFSILAFSIGARAADYNIYIGQSASLSQGDVAIVRDAGGGISAVTCGGAPAPTLPPRHQFEIAREVRFSDLFQTGSDIGRSIQCGKISAEPQITQAVNDALNAAREACFNTGYTYCAQPAETAEQFSFYVRGGPGTYTCEVVARIVGTF